MADLTDCLSNCLGGILRSGEDLHHAQTAGNWMGPDAVSKGAAGIDGNAQRRNRSLETSRQAVRFYTTGSDSSAELAALHHQVGSDEDKEDDGDDSIHGKKCSVELA